jgi:hypothetical protein
MIELPHRHFIATVHPPYFIDANRLRPHRSLSICPSNPNPHSSAGFGPLQQFFRMLAKFFNLTVHLLP